MSEQDFFHLTNAKVWGVWQTELRPSVDFSLSSCVPTLEHKTKCMPVLPMFAYTSNLKHVEKQLNFQFIENCHQRSSGLNLYFLNYFPCFTESIPKFPILSMLLASLIFPDQDFFINIIISLHNNLFHQCKVGTQHLGLWTFINGKRQPILSLNLNK